MAVAAADTFHVHLAAEKRCVLVVLVAHLAVGIVEIGLVHNRQQMMIVE